MCGEGEGGKGKTVMTTDSMCYTTNLQQLSPTFVKEGDVVVLHRSEVHILPKIRLLRGVRRQETLSMESLL